ncbi:hypothetical protein D3C76_538210 [compost metagenome]
MRRLMRRVKLKATHPDHRKWFGSSLERHKKLSSGVVSTIRTNCAGFIRTCRDQHRPDHSPMHPASPTGEHQ